VQVARALRFLVCSRPPRLPRSQVNPNYVIQPSDGIRGWPEVSLLEVAGWCEPTASHYMGSGAAFRDRSSWVLAKLVPSWAPWPLPRLMIPPLAPYSPVGRDLGPVLRGFRGRKLTAGDKRTFLRAGHGILLRRALCQLLPAWLDNWGLNLTSSCGISLARLFW
jgi:hypothetical protein